MMYRQLEIRWIDLDPTRGAETQKKRPCVILQSDLVNRGSRTVIVAPILSGHKPWPFVVNVRPTKANGLDKDRHINVKQLRAVDVSKVDNKQGTLESRYLGQIEDAIKIVFGLS
ncbi:type II toxin-antitoxin system PemK/MazF family toxin [Catalinimonas sp. 4WD22]|uniref:type II toxin-antitoxin system PemK/MazF family toxin n=1 Tax=Catalinimonas locisalis TaxID=3133978 RepID=UPI003100CC76